MLCASVTTWAHSPRVNMYKLSRMKRVKVLYKLKALAFIEKLSGPDIGFYCYRLYPMNNHQFYVSTLAWAVNYFLVINLIADMSF